MLNIVWPVFIIISIIFAILFGNIGSLNSAILESTDVAVNLCLTLVGTICLWSGVMKIASNTSVIQKITYVLNPLIKLLFPNLKKESKVYKEISMNMVANILGLGNAATPLRNKGYEIYARRKFKKRYINK